MKIKLLVVLAAAAAILSGCGTAAILDRSARDPSDTESIVVFKVNPATYNLLFFPGSIENGRFKQSAVSNAQINGGPVQGYLVAKARAGETLALTSIYEPTNVPLMVGKQFHSCGAKSVVIEVPKSKVGYVTDIEYETGGNGISVRYKQDLQAASTHIRANFPGITQEVQPLAFQLLPADACGPGPTPIPIYIGR